MVIFFHFSERCKTFMSRSLKIKERIYRAFNTQKSLSYTRYIGFRLWSVDVERKTRIKQKHSRGREETETQANRQTQRKTQAATERKVRRTKRVLEMRTALENHEKGP